MSGAEVAAAIRVLELGGDLEWGRFGLGAETEALGVPLLVWRYRDEPPWFAEVVESTVTTFAGRCEWSIEKPGRNWVLWPAKAQRDFEIGTWRTDAEYLVWLSENDPKFCTAASNDLSPLLDLIGTRLRETLESPNDLT